MVTPVYIESENAIEGEGRGSDAEVMVAAVTPSPIFLSRPNAQLRVK
jgi:hypothetical protein